MAALNSIALLVLGLAPAQSRDCPPPGPQSGLRVDCCVSSSLPAAPDRCAWSPRWRARGSRVRADRWSRVWDERTASIDCGGSARLRLLAKLRILDAEARRRAQRLEHARRMVAGQAVRPPAAAALRRALRRSR